MLIASFLLFNFIKEVFKLCCFLFLFFGADSFNLLQNDIYKTVRMIDDAEEKEVSSIALDWLSALNLNLFAQLHPLVNNSAINIGTVTSPSEKNH